MERVTISMSDEFADELATFMETHNYANRSEAIRDLARQGLKQARLHDAVSGACVAALSYVYNHHARDLSKRLTDAYHAHHDLQVATTHVHLDHDSCLEVALLRGQVAAVREFANAVIAERGVTHGQVSLVPVRIETGSHAHGRRHPHVHTHPSG
ncbi:MAG: nickel-responsive transcriptional regulator NikR [Alphaproteobacteria bacterium]|nr:nickel-responsive transcriptional regulator NikR [Mycobacterium sp.]MBV9755444.1 nickel-responsive transcriptional regulator NikR [Alphaproteobacteria bacterium]